MNDKQKREVARDLYDKLIAYWHEVDFNWGRNAGEYYMEDAIFRAAPSMRGQRHVLRKNVRMAIDNRCIQKRVFH